VTATDRAPDRRGWRLGVGVLGLALACTLAFVGWVLLTKAGKRPDPWIGITVTACGLAAAGLVGLRDRDITARDRRDELAATCVLACLALIAFAVGREDAPPWFIWILFGVLVALAVACGRPTAEPASRLSFRAALAEAVGGPVLYRGLTLLGVLLASSAST
jgi:peptidoglycan/LPS O-acetylase OafA/YrhL